MSLRGWKTRLPANSSTVLTPALRTPLSWSTRAEGTSSGRRPGGRSSVTSQGGSRSLAAVTVALNFFWPALYSADGVRYWSGRRIDLTSICPNFFGSFGLRSSIRRISKLNGGPLAAGKVFGGVLGLGNVTALVSPALSDRTAVLPSGTALPPSSSST